MQQLAAFGIAGATTMLDEEQCWKAVVEKDQSQDGRFYFGVVTTGVYCRPSCAARLPLRKNVRFYENRKAAEEDGLRACLRCRPDGITTTDSNRLRVRRLCDHIRANCTSGESMRLEDLAKHIGLSPFHFQRTFRAVTGLTPREYVESCRIESFKKDVQSGQSVTDAIYGAGFGSSSRVYERAGKELGMTPREFQTGGKGIEITYLPIESALGPLMIGATDRGLCFVQFGESKEELLGKLVSEYPSAQLVKAETPYSAPLKMWIDHIRRYLRHEQIRLDLPLDVPGTAFQMKVWRYLQSIPTGEVRSYREVAEQLGLPKAARAVAQACAANHVALVIPCHRVVRGDGSVSGYRWGVERKKTLLESEKAVFGGL